MQFFPNLQVGNFRFRAGIICITFFVQKEVGKIAGARFEG